MKNDNANLLKSLQPIKHLIPLNYLKAKPVYFENQPKDIRNLLKFIPIENLKTENGLVHIPPKAISKCLELTKRNETKTL